MTRDDDDGFDPVGLAELSEMTGESVQNLLHLMGRPEAPEPVQLARMKVWRRSEAKAYLTALEERGDDGRRPWGAAGRRRESVTVAELKDGTEILAGTVIAVRFSESGKTAYITVRDGEGEIRKLLGRPASGKIVVLAAAGGRR